MKNLFFLAAILSLAASTMSCKSKKETSSSATASASNTTASETKADDPNKLNCRLVVSFISKGAGLDREKNAAFMEYITGHPKKPAYKEVRWGREGETDYCFRLAELDTKKDQESFIEGLKKIAAGSDMMVITENAPPHKGRQG